MYRNTPLFVEQRYAFYLSQRWSLHIRIPINNKDCVGQFDITGTKCWREIIKVRNFLPRLRVSEAFVCCFGCVRGQTALLK